LTLSARGFLYDPGKEAPHEDIVDEALSREKDAARAA